MVKSRFDHLSFRLEDSLELISILRCTQASGVSPAHVRHQKQLISLLQTVNPSFRSIPADLTCSRDSCTLQISSVQASRESPRVKFLEKLPLSLPLIAVRQFTPLDWKYIISKYCWVSRLHRSIKPGYT